MTKFGDVASLVALVAGSLNTAAYGQAGFELCEGLSTEKQARCLYETGSGQGAEEEAADRLRELAEVQPADGWPIFYLANALWNLDRAAALEAYRSAADQFAAAGDAAAEIRTRINLSTILGFGQRFAEAAEQLEAAEQALTLSNDPVDQASFDLGLARLLMLKGEDLETADGLLQGAKEVIFGTPGASFHLRRECLRSLGQVTMDLGLYGRAQAYFKQSFELASAAGNRSEQASAAYDRTGARMAAEPPNEDRRKRALEDMRTNLALAEEGGNRPIEVYARHEIAVLAGGPEAVGHLDRCLARGDGGFDFIGIGRIRRQCLLTLAHHRLEEDGDEIQARELLAEAYATGLETDDPWALVRGWAPMLRVLWKTSPTDEAAAAAESVLSAIEGLRRAQAGGAGDRLLSTWSGAYFWLSGRLLELAETDPGSDELSRAFAVIERHRALHLREILERDQPPEDALPADLATGQHELQQRVTAVYRRLLDPDLEPAERDLQLDELERLEQDEVELQRRIADLTPARVSLPPPPHDLLEQIATGLGEDEALLSFQLASWQGYDRRFAGGSWVVVVTRDGARAHRLPERADLESRIEFVLGGDWGEEDRPALARIYQDLLEDAIDELPPGVGRLVLVPDGLLHLLPFAALRPSPDEPPLAERFELATVPSAALWLRWKDHAPPGGDAFALVMAAPELPARSQQGSSRSRAWALASGEALGPLPYARREGEKVVAHLRGASDLLAGAEASEKFLKGTDLTPYGVIHFATHAVVNDERPWRSAVVLSAGGDEEDGLLRPSEISRLPLKDKVVVLSTCDSAVGEILRGEGVISLARSFFEAGARGVVATIRRLPDKEGADFFNDFYRHLSRGLSLRGALAATQRRWIEKGKPAAVWASVVVLGNGDLVLAPNAEPPSSPRTSTLAAVLLALAAVLVLVFVFRRRRQG